jgi:TctA family transporter
MASAGSYLPLVQRPMSATMLAIAALLFVWPFVREWRRALGPADRPPDTGPYTRGG